MDAPSVRPGTAVRSRVRPAGAESLAERGSRDLGRWVFLSVLAVTAAQFGFLAFGCDWDLCGDEAEYWAWSRRLDWSYYAKGPLIAVIIRLGTIVAGDLSLAW